MGNNPAGNASSEAQNGEEPNASNVNNDRPKSGVGSNVSRPASVRSRLANAKNSGELETYGSSKIPRDLFIKFINCLREMPFYITEEQFQDLANSLELVSYKKDDLILEMGKMGKGIFLVVEGYCKVMNKDGVKIRYIEDGDYFGEVSTFYNRPCSASVTAGKDVTKMLMLPDEVIDQFLQRPVDYDLVDLFVGRRYRDLENTSTANEVIKRIAKEAITKAPPFLNWTSEAVGAILEQVVPQKVICYPVHAHVFFADDIDSNGFLLLQGVVEIHGDNKGEKTSEVLNAGPTGLWFGDEQLFCPTRRQLTAISYTPCIILVFSALDFQTITENFAIESSLLMNLSSRWKKMVEVRDTSHDQQCHPGIEMLRLSLRKTQFLAMVPSGMIYILALGVTCRELTNEEPVFKGNEQKNHMFIVLSGCVIAEASSKAAVKKYGSHEVFFPDDDHCDLSFKSDGDCLVGILSAQTFRDAQDLYPEAIVNWESLGKVVS